MVCVCVWCVCVCVVYVEVGGGHLRRDLVDQLPTLTERAIDQSDLRVRQQRCQQVSASVGKNPGWDAARALRDELPERTLA